MFEKRALPLIRRGNIAAARMAIYDVPAVLSMSRSRQASSEICHLKVPILKTRLSFEQSRREFAGRLARVGYSLLAIARTRHAGPPFSPFLAIIRRANR